MSGAETLLTAIAAALPLGAAGALLGLFKSPRRKTPLAERIEAQLPQTQCGECGYAGCKPYAEAVAGGAPHNRCAPGGQATVKALADLLAIDEVPLTIEGEIKPRAVAYIREAECIGCTKCIQACPVDAIVGAAKLMHTVIAAECTGCDLCVAPCPVDCIDMLPLPEPIAPVLTGAAECIRCGLCAPECPAGLLPQQLYSAARRSARDELEQGRLFDCIECGACAQVCPSTLPLVQHYQNAKAALRDEDRQYQSAQLARVRFEAHQQRSQREAEQREQRRQARLQKAAATTAADVAKPDAVKSKQDVVREAIARAKAKKSAPPADGGSSKP